MPEVKNPLKKDDENPVSERLLKFHDEGLSVDEARRQMLEAQEPAKVGKRLAKVPDWIREEKRD
jgi:hypothetical protein